jgi:hypothetical protein
LAGSIDDRLSGFFDWAQESRKIEAVRAQLQFIHAEASQVHQIIDQLGDLLSLAFDNIQGLIEIPGN